MSKQKLEKALEYLVNEEVDKASEILKSYIIETAADIHQKLVESEEDVMEMDREVTHDDMGDDLADEIAADKDEIKSEEMFGEDAEEGEGDELEMDGEDHVEGEEASEEHLDLEDLESEMEELASEVDAVDAHSDTVEASLDDMGAKFDKLAAEFEKIKNTEEVEHGEDFDDNGVLGDEDHAEMPGDEMASEEPAAEMPDMGAEDDGLEESIELHAVKADMKDKAPGAGEKSPVPMPKDRLSRLGGEPVKQSGPTHKGFDRETKKVGEVTKHSNTVGSGKSALDKKSVEMKDKAPGAGESPAMPKGKK